jgi:hypothetical protein
MRGKNEARFPEMAVHKLKNRKDDVDQMEIHPKQK